MHHGFIRSPSPLPHTVQRTDTWHPLLASFNSVICASRNIYRLLCEERGWNGLCQPLLSQISFGGLKLWNVMFHWGFRICCTQTCSKHFFNCHWKCAGLQILLWTHLHFVNYGALNTHITGNYKLNSFFNRMYVIKLSTNRPLSLKFQKQKTSETK